MAEIEPIVNGNMEFPGDFILDAVEITSHTGNKKSLRFVMEELNLFEDLFSPSLSGNIVISDALNLPLYMPIQGHDKLRIKFSTPFLNGEQKIVDLTFRVYKISKREYVSERKQNYILHFVSEEQYSDSKNKISKAYKGTLSEIASKVFIELKSKKQLKIEQTKDQFDVIIPFWSPFKTLNWLAARSYSTLLPDTSGANFVFFESLDGFHYESVESILKAQTTSKQKYIFQPANHRLLDNHNARDLEKDFRAVIGFSIDGTFDILESLGRGMYSSKLWTHDIITKEYKEYRFDYSKTFEKDGHIHVEENIKAGGQGKTMLCLEDESFDKLNTSYDANQRLFPKHKHLFGDGSDPTRENNNHVERWLQNRASQLQQLNSIKITIVVPGDSSRKVGDRVEFFIPSSEPIENEMVFDPYISGNYLVVAVKHTINHDKYFTTLQIVKDALFEPMLNVGQNDTTVQNGFRL